MTSLQCTETRSTCYDSSLQLTRFFPDLHCLKPHQLPMYACGSPHIAGLHHKIAPDSHQVAPVSTNIATRYCSDPLDSLVPLHKIVLHHGSRKNRPSKYLLILKETALSRQSIDLPIRREHFCMNREEKYTSSILPDLTRPHADEQPEPDQVPAADFRLKTSDLNSH